MARATTLLLLFLFEAMLYASEPQPQSPYPTVAAEVGEHCVVCGMPLSSSDIAIILKGRRIPVMKDMAASVLKNPEIYFKSKQARGALFHEDFQAPPGAVQAGVNLSWFLAGLYVLSALAFGALGAVAAVSKGLAPISGFYLGLGLSVFGYLYVLTRPSQAASLDIPAGFAKVPVTQSPLACPQCGNTNHPAAASCAVCHVALSPQGHSDLSRAG
jgi:hypothetical protein